MARKLSDGDWLAIYTARQQRPPESWRSLAQRLGVSHTSLTRGYARREAVRAEQRRVERAARQAADPARPETTPEPAKPAATPPEGVPVVPYGTGGIGAWWAAPEIETAVPDQYPNSHLVGVKELYEDRAPNMDLTEKIRAHPRPDPHRAHR